MSRRRHRQHAQKCGKDRARGSGYILADRQTDTQTHTQTSSLYFMFVLRAYVTLEFAYFGHWIGLTPTPVQK